jgi:rare lipoprotein A
MRKKRRMRVLRLVAIVAALALTACTGVLPNVPPGGAEQATFTELGIASWYGRGHHGKRTANGERFDMNRMTAAHKSIELGTVVRVTSLETGETVKVRVNDRGPYIRGRVVDLSDKAARHLGIREAGIARVRVEIFASDQELARSALE